MRAARYPRLRTIVADALPYHEAGASDGQELGCALATGVAYLRALTERGGLDVDAAARQLEFRFAATADQFATIAKLRAARRLWARVAEVAGAAVRSAPQHAVTSSTMMTRRDPWVNMLRTTVACFAAGVGGADAVTVQPFDSAIGLPDAFARRIARNTQSILLEESTVAGVIDPAGGSWYVERLHRRAGPCGLGGVHRRSSGRAGSPPRSRTGRSTSGSRPPARPAPPGSPPGRSRSPA